MDNIEYAKKILESEAGTLRKLAENIGKGFDAAVTAVLNCRGRVIVTGIGKAGTIGQKVTATLSSTGTPAYSIHPAEAMHGDLGAILDRDIVLCFSNSGESEEITRLLPVIKKIGAAIICVTGQTRSTLAEHSDHVIDIGEITEACPLGLAPTNSTTAMLAVGDALALCVSKNRNFDKERYALYHPGGEIGRKLMKVSELMKVGGAFAAVSPDTPLRDVLLVITRSRAGAACVADADRRLVGIFTDGDLRRYLAASTDLSVPVQKVMTTAPKSATGEDLCTEALQTMKKFQIDELPVLDADGRLAGILDVQDLLKAGIVR